MFVSDLKADLICFGMFFKKFKMILVYLNHVQFFSRTEILTLVIGQCAGAGKMHLKWEAIILLMLNCSLLGVHWQLMINKHILHRYISSCLKMASVTLQKKINNTFYFNIHRWVSPIISKKLLVLLSIYIKNFR